MRRALRRAWVGLCIGFLALFLSARALHYAGVGLPRPLDEFFGLVLKFRLLMSWSSFIFSFITWTPLFLLCLLLLVVRFRWCVRREPRGWALRPWLESFLWAMFAANGILLDVTPEATALWALALPVLAVRARLSGDARRSRIVGLALAGVFAFWLLGRPPLSTIAYGAVFAAGLLAACRLPLFRFRDLAAVSILLAGPLQIATVFDPAGLSRVDATLLGEGGVYGFCETPDGRLLASVSRCGDFDVEQCRAGTVAEYRLDDLSQRRAYHLFDDDFYGRLLVAVCLEDSAIVSMGATRIDGELRRLNAMEFTFDDPPVVTRRLPVGEGGGRVLYDPDRDVLYSLDEFSNDVVRIDRRTGETGGFHLGPERERAVWLGMASLWGSLSTEVDARSDRRDTLFFGEWLLGQTVYEVDRDTLEVVAEYDPNNGGNFSIAVDEPLGRLILSGLWGIDVIDLETGRPIFRRSTSAGPRMPLIDTARNLVYVSTPFGNVRVFDRLTFEPLGQIPVGGFGARSGHLSRDGRRLFLSNDTRQFYWDAERLAQRFGRGTGATR